MLEGKIKNYFFISGLPRAGSTLLSTLLNQNPDIYASTNSPVCGTISNVNRDLQLSEQYRAFPRPQALNDTLVGILESYYKELDAPIIADKSREWATPENFSLLESYLPTSPKVIVLVRDVLEILSSFISLAHSSPEGSSLDAGITTQEFNFYRPVDDIRCDYLMKPKGLIDNAMYGVANAVANYGTGNFLLVDYQDLVDTPKDVLAQIYAFLEVPEYEHSLTGLRNPVPEDDTVYGLVGMHDVHPTVAKRNISTDILSEYVKMKYSGLEFWKNN